MHAPQLDTIVPRNRLCTYKSNRDKQAPIEQDELVLSLCPEAKEIM